jgi:hypothetical protein
MSYSIEEVGGKTASLFKNKTFLMIAGGVGVLALVVGHLRNLQDQNQQDTGELAYASYPQAPADYQQDLENYKTVIESEMNQMAANFQSSISDIQQMKTDMSSINQKMSDIQKNYQASLQQAVQNLTKQNEALMQKVIHSSAPAPTKTNQTAKQALIASINNPNYHGNSIVDYLKGAHVDSSYSNRAKIAATLGITNYHGTAEQNLQMLRMLQSDDYKYKTVSASKPIVSKKPDPKQALIARINNPNYHGNSLVDYLKGAHVDSSYSNRAKIAAALGIKNYRGTAEQNLQMLRMLRSDDYKYKKK